MSVDTNNAAFQDALNLIQYTRQSVFLTGKAGTGKSTERTHSRVLQVHQTAPEITGTD